MALQSRSLVEPSLAHWAIVGGLSKMQYFVNCQRSRLTKTFSTVIALERLVFGVYVLVISQVVLPPERLAADVTGERPLVCVGSLVDQQVVALRELPVAKFADEPFLGSASSTNPCVEPRVLTRPEVW